MSMSGDEAYILAMDYVDETLKGAGALKGQDGKDGVSPVISVNTSTSDTYKLDITDKNGTITTPNLVGKQGLQGIQGEQGKPADNPIITENVDNTEDVYKLDLTVGETVFTTKNIIGKQGLEGVSPSVTTNPDNTAEDYRLNITTKGGTFTTPNLRGPQGEIGPQGESAASAINPRGDYDVNAEPHYTVSDYITSSEGNTYVCKKDNPDNVAPTDGTVNDEFWQVLALRGAKGESGKDGEKGADGVTFTPSIDENGVLSFTNNGGLENPEPIDIKGDNGITFTPSIDADGYLSFTNNGNLENPEPIKVLGKDGADGKDGIDGTTYIPSIGTVTTVESNADASAGVTVDEETKEAVFNFAIPKGNKGLDGVQISDNETVENKTWSSKKTSSKIAKVETELNAKVDKKEYYNALDYGNPIIPQDADLNDYLTPGVYTCMSSTIANTLLNCPHIGSNFKLIVNKNRGNDDTLFYGYQMIVGTKGGNPVTDVCVYYRGISVYNNVCVFSKWKIMSGSTVADVPVTNIAPSDTTTFINFAGNSSCCYFVRNGICHVNIEGGKIASSGAKIRTGVYLPKSANCQGGTFLTGGGDATPHAYVFVLRNSCELCFDVKDANVALYGSFSYPVAES